VSMSQKFGMLMGAALIGGLGLCSVASPAQAGPVTFGLLTHLSAVGGNVPGGVVNAIAIYGNIAGVLGPDAGLTLSGDDPTAAVTPPILSPGLTSASVDLTADGSSANVAASLASGVTHISAFTSQGGNGPQTSAFTEVLMTDTLTFFTGGGPVAVTLGFGLDGTLTSGGSGSYSQSIRYQIGTADMEWVGATGAGGGPSTGSTSGFTSPIFTNDTINGFNFQGTFTVTNGEVLNLFFQQSINCGNGENCDFSNTGQMSLAMPGGTGFTSAGGFLSQQSVPGVPEPASILLVALGITAVVCAKRRRLAR
jgi:hypothetical protein